jgi:hypothetical protein
MVSTVQTSPKVLFSIYETNEADTTRAPFNFTTGIISERQDLGTSHALAQLKCYRVGYDLIRPFKLVSSFLVTQFFFTEYGRFSWIYEIRTVQ